MDDTHLVASIPVASAPDWHPDILRGVSAGFWVFAYGSLMWRPDFPHQEGRLVTLHGWHRRLCVASHRYRGTPARPGLVMGLDRGGCCVGMAFRVAAADVSAALDLLWEREMVNLVYTPSWVRARFREDSNESRWISALAFVAVRGHPQYCPRLSEDEVAARVAGCSGVAGRNLDYLVDTVACLRGLGIRDRRLDRQLAAARARAAGLESWSGERRG